MNFDQERRRLSIACGLITLPSLIFLDEPTSGLDATNARIVMGKLFNLTQQKVKVTVVVVIHQPRPEVIFNSFFFQIYNLKILQSRFFQCFQK